MHRLPLFALVLFLSTDWWGAVLHAKATALGLQALTAAEQPAPPPPPTRPGPTTDGGCEIDPLGCPEGQ